MRIETNFLQEKLLEKKYELADKDIFSLDENSIIWERNKQWRECLVGEGLEWPVEIQGAAISDFENKELKIYYPLGDKFVSFCVLMHELGHWRQGEAHREFSKKNLGAPEPDEDSVEKFSFEIEKDAWKRGVERLKKYCPEVWDELETDFNNSEDLKISGDFKSFEDFFNFVKDSCLTVAQYSRENEEFELNKEGARGLVEFIKNNNQAEKFFFHQDLWKTGQKINQDTVENIIRKIAFKVAEENYENN